MRAETGGEFSQGGSATRFEVISELSQGKSASRFEAISETSGRFFLCRLRNRDTYLSIHILALCSIFV